MQAAAIDWHVYLLTRSPLALGMVGLSRVIPIVSLSLLGGVVADRFDRKRVMLATQLTMSAAAGAFDNPARQALVPRLVPREDLPGALAMNLTMFHAGMIGGPAIAGVLIASAGEGTRGLAWIYLSNAASFLTVVTTLLRMRASGKIEATGAAPESPLG